MSLVYVSICAGDVVITDSEQRTFWVFEADGQLRHHVALEPFALGIGKNVFVCGAADLQGYVVAETSDSDVLQLCQLQPDPSCSLIWKVRTR